MKGRRPWTRAKPSWSASVRPAPARRRALVRGEVSRPIAVANLVNARRYELWRTPQVEPGCHLYGYQGDVQVSRKPVSSELREDRI